MNDLVSIIMPSYNTAFFIKDSIQSVINQTYQNWELIIVDDCSSDDTDSTIADFHDNRMRYYRNEAHLGAALSRNKALRDANGRWIAFLDSDDLWMPDKLEKQIAFMEANGYSFSYTSYEEINLEGKKTGIRVTGPKRITEKGMFDFCWPGCLTVMYDRNVVGLVQIEDIKKNNDYAMWLKVCKISDCYLLDDVLAKYRRGRIGSVSTQSIFMLIRWHYLLFRDAEKEPLAKALLNTARNIVFGVYKKFRYVQKIDV